MVGVTWLTLPMSEEARRSGAAAAPSARAGLLAGAKLMALSAVDLLASGSRLRAIKEEFARR